MCNKNTWNIFFRNIFLLTFNEFSTNPNYLINVNILVQYPEVCVHATCIKFARLVRGCFRTGIKIYFHTGGWAVSHPCWPTGSRKISQTHLFFPLSRKAFLWQVARRYRWSFKKLIFLALPYHRIRKLRQLKSPRSQRQTDEWCQMIFYRHGSVN